MKMTKKILLVLGVLIAIPLIVALFLKKDYDVKREITINKSNTEVFEYVKFLKNQDHFSKWNMMDPNMKKTYKGTDGTVGFIAAWESQNENVGAGEQEILKITEGERIDMKLRFKIPFETEDNAYMITENLGNNQTKVTWGFHGTMPYPMNLFGLFMDMDKELGGDLEIGLQNLKVLLEK